MVRLGDDVGSQELLMSPETWRKWLKPRMAKVIAAARRSTEKAYLVSQRRRYRAHSHDLVEMGSMLNPGQPSAWIPWTFGVVTVRS